MPGPNVNIGQWVRKNALIYPKKIATKAGDRAFSYAALDERVSRIATGLRAAGLRKGDRLAVLLLNCPEYVELVFACSAAGLITVPLNWRLGQQELELILRDCEPKVLVHHTGFGERTAQLQAAVPSIARRLAVDEAGGPSPYEDLVRTAAADDAVDPTVGGDDPHLIMYTAGTTGTPKGVVLTHANCFWQSVNGWALGVSPSTVALVVLPLFHVGGLNGSVTPMIHVGATVVLPAKFDAGDTLDTIERERVTGMVAVPAVYQMLYDHPRFEQADLGSVEALISGGAPLSLDLIRKYHARGIEFRQGYGLTETSPGVTGMGPGECLQKAGTAGRPCLYVDVEIVDADDRAVARGTPGEVRVRGPNVMAGYWNRPEETAKVLRDGWFYSGDIGFLDEDSYLVLVDRKKDMIISGGENVYPAEIEKVLEQHPAVAEVAVVGRADARWGEVPVAFVVLRKGSHASCEELLELCARRIARYKTPKEILVRDALPRNAAGKILKPELRRQLADR
jgi:fatty-acyl-CoA synthase